MPRGKLLNQPIMGNALNKPGDAGGTDMIHELGSLAEVWDSTNGHQIWRYVQSSVAVAVGEGVCIVAGGGPSSKMRLVPSAADPSLLKTGGIAQSAFAINDYGWVLAKGWGTILGDAAGVAANTKFVPGASAGAFKAAAAVTDDGAGVTGAAVGAATAATAYIDLI
jgi:hypothetical protein